jgi:hypothetical protein
MYIHETDWEERREVSAVCRRSKVRPPLARQLQECSFTGYLHTYYTVFLHRFERCRTAQLTKIGSIPGLPDGLFSNPKSQFWQILEGLRLENVDILGIFYWQRYFMTIWYILCYLVHFSRFWYRVPRKSGNPDQSYFVVCQIHAIRHKFTNVCWTV